MDELYLTVSPEWSTQVRDWQETLCECKSCGRDFYEINNIGAWLCSQHVSIEVPVPGYNWSCCGKKFVSDSNHIVKGCVPADHSASRAPYDEGDDISMPLPLANVVQLYKKSKAPLEGGKFARNAHRVRRFDWKRAAALGHGDPFPFYRT